MKLTSIQIVNFTTSDYSELLRLLLELHSTYFNKYASPRIKELQEEKNLKHLMKYI
jgi:hypothetical protein